KNGCFNASRFGFSIGLRVQEAVSTSPLFAQLMDAAGVTAAVQECFEHCLSTASPDTDPVVHAAGAEWGVRARFAEYVHSSEVVPLAQAPEGYTGLVSGCGIAL
ncbi:hypothetical protein KIPB_016197, partial [Kipferlia bialata]